MSKYLERAEKIRAIVEPHHNCCQSVLMTFSPELNISDEAAYQIGFNFGGGMKCGDICGALIGTQMVLGLMDINDPAIASRVVKEFKERHQGCNTCVELLKLNKDTGIEKKVHCDGIVYECVKVIEELMKENNK